MRSNGVHPKSIWAVAPGSAPFSGSAKKKTVPDIHEHLYTRTRIHLFSQASGRSCSFHLRGMHVQDGEDPFTRLEREKSERVSGNKKRNAQNREEALLATNKNSTVPVPATVKLSTKLDPASIRGQIAKGKALKKELKQASYYAGVSTASMGKFDKRLKGEKDNERKLPGSRKKVLAVTGGAAEQDAAGKVLGKVIR